MTGALGPRLHGALRARTVGDDDGSPRDEGRRRPIGATINRWADGIDPPPWGIYVGVRAPEGRPVQGDTMSHDTLRASTTRWCTASTARRTVPCGTTCGLRATTRPAVVRDAGVLRRFAAILGWTADSRVRDVCSGTAVRPCTWERTPLRHDRARGERVGVEIAHRDDAEAGIANRVRFVQAAAWTCRSPTARSTS